jgi:RNA polymerase sigma factor (sigma-70 family)
MNQAMAGAVPPVGNVSWSGTEAAYANSYRELLRVAYVLTGSGAAAEDVVHDVFCRVGPRVAELDNPAAYLRVAVVNQCRSLHRRFTRAPRPSVVPDAQLDTGLTEFRDALQSLPVRQRTAVVLRYLCDLPDGEIAGILDCRPATVRSLIHRGLAALRTQIAPSS